MHFLLPAVAVVLAAASPRVLTLETPLPVCDVAAHDINLDGRADLFVLCADADKSPVPKKLVVFLAGPDGSYPPTGSITMDLDTSIGALFFAETDGAPPKDLVTVDARGARILSWRDGRFESSKLIAFSSLFPSNVKKPIFLTRTALDLTGDGIDEWLVPFPSGYAVRTPDGAMHEVVSDIESGISNDDNVKISHKLPAQHPFRLPGDPHRGIAFLSEKYVDYVYGENWSRHVRYDVPIDLQEKWEGGAQMDDINGDGLPDLIVTQMQGRINIKVDTDIYVASQPFRFPETPSASFHVSGALTAPLLEDVDGDGKKDLVFLKVPLGVKLFVNYFVMQKLTIQVEVHLFKDGGFDPEPDFRNNLTVDAPEGRERAAYAMADFNGDKRLDVAFGGGTDQMEVYVGTPNRFISSKPWLTLDLPSFGEARTYRLDDNESDDIVMFHPVGEHVKRVHVALFP